MMVIDDNGNDGYDILYLLLLWIWKKSSTARQTTWIFSSSSGTRQQHNEIKKLNEEIDSINVLLCVMISRTIH